MSAHPGSEKVLGFVYHTENHEKHEGEIVNRNSKSNEHKQDTRKNHAKKGQTNQDRARRDCFAKYVENFGIFYSRGKMTQRY